MTDFWAPIPIRDTKPSWSLGYARHAGESMAPDQWQGLVALWLPWMGAQGSQLYDVSGYGYHGTLTNMEPDTDWVPSALDGVALDFDGSNEHVITADIPLGTAGLTVMAWARPDVNNVTGGLVSQSTWNSGFSNTGFALFHGSADWLFMISTIGTNVIDATQVGGVVVGQWSHVCGVYDNETVSLYVDGVLREADTTASGAVFDSTLTVLLGATRLAGVAAEFFNGQIAQARIYTRALSPAEVVQSYQDPMAIVRRREPRLYWLSTIVTIPQLARPIADIIRDNWETHAGGTTNLYQTLDETVADDADYIRTQLTPTSDVFVPQLGTPTDPVSSSGHILRWRYGKDAAGGAAISLTVQLREGYTNEGSQGALIATAATLTDIPSGWTVGSYTLTGPESDAISNYGSGLSVRLLADCPIAPSNPAIVTSTTTPGTTASTTPVINLPASLVAGNLIIVLFRCAVAGAIGWPDASWIELFDASSDAADDQMALAYHTVTGAEGSTITLSSGNGKFAALAWQISGAEDVTVQAPELSTVATGTATEPDATTVTPTGGSKTYLFGVIYGMEGEQTGITTYPSGYTAGQLFETSGTAAAVTTNVTLGGAWKQATAASDNPAAWDVTGTLDDWTAYAIAVHPKAARRAQVSWLEFQVPEAPAGGGRTSKNTHPWPLGVNLGMGIGMPA